MGEKLDDWPHITLKGDMPIQLSTGLGARVRKGAQVVIVKSVPEAMFDGCAERQSIRNHVQTLAEIRGRSGFDAIECLAVLSAQNYRDIEGLSEEAGHRILYSMVATFNRGQRVAEAASPSNPEPSNDTP